MRLSRTGVSLRVDPWFEQRELAPQVTALDSTTSHPLHRPAFNVPLYWRAFVRPDSDWDRYDGAWWSVSDLRRRTPRKSGGPHDARTHTRPIFDHVWVAPNLGGTQFGHRAGRRKDTRNAKTEVAKLGLRKVVSSKKRRESVPARNVAAAPCNALLARSRLAPFEHVFTLIECAVRTG